VSRVARESVRGLLPPDGLAPWRQPLMPRYAPLRGRLRHAVAAMRRRGLRHPLREWLDGVSDALCMLPPLASGLTPLRHSGNTLAPTPTGDVRHEVARVLIREQKDPVFCHRYPTGPCVGGNPKVRRVRDNVASA